MFTHGEGGPISNTPHTVIAKKNSKEFFSRLPRLLFYLFGLLVGSASVTVEWVTCAEQIPRNCAGQNGVVHTVVGEAFAVQIDGHNVVSSANFELQMPAESILRVDRKRVFSSGKKFNRGHGIKSACSQLERLQRRHCGSVEDAAVGVVRDDDSEMLDLSQCTTFARCRTA